MSKRDLFRSILPYVAQVGPIKTYRDWVIPELDLGWILGFIQWVLRTKKQGLFVQWVLGPNRTQKIGPICINKAKKALFRSILPYIAQVGPINTYREKVGPELDPGRPPVASRTQQDPKNRAYLCKLGQKYLIRSILPYIAQVGHINTYRDQVGHGLDPRLPLVGPRTQNLGPTWSL